MPRAAMSRRDFFWMLLLALTVGVIAAAGFYVTPLVLAEEDEDDTPDVVFVPTPHDVVAKMLEVAGVKKEDVVYDLGCGDGRIVATAAKKFGCKGVGFDINQLRVDESNATLDKFNVKHLVTIKKENIFDADLTKASVITLYLLPELNARLIPQLEKMKPGSRIVSHEYDMQKKAKPDKEIRMTSREDNTEHIIYLWTIPLKMEEEEKKEEDKKEEEKKEEEKKEEKKE